MMGRTLMSGCVTVLALAWCAPALGSEAAVFYSRGYPLEDAYETSSGGTYRTSGSQGAELEFWPGISAGSHKRIAFGIRYGWADARESQNDFVNSWKRRHTHLSSMIRVDLLRAGPFSGTCDAALGLGTCSTRTSTYPGSVSSSHTVVHLSLTGQWRLSEIFGLRGKIGYRRLLGDESLYISFRSSALVQVGVTVVQ